MQLLFLKNRCESLPGVPSSRQLCERQKPRFSGTLHQECWVSIAYHKKKIIAHISNQHYFSYHEDDYPKREIENGFKFRQLITTGQIAFQIQLCYKI